VFRVCRHFILFSLALGLPTLAAAQARVPDTDSAAIGGDIGIFLPREEGMKSGLALDGFYEYYFTPRTSVRLGAGWMNPKFDTEEDDSLRAVRIGGDVVYNWEGGVVHPFAGAGLGIYFLQLRDNGDSLGDSETKLGGVLFGGVEYFTSRTLAIKGEARYHIVGDIDELGGLNPGGLSLSIGVKTYF
jgi:hypothetical protein